jgi:MFS transporter, ACS family, hexuronate transporter
MLWVIPWLLINRAHPSKHPWLTDNERDHILSGQSRADQTGQGRVLSWKELLSYRQSWSVIASRFFLDPIWWMFVNWLPIYLNEQFKFDIKQIGLFAWIPYVGAAAGSLLGGWSSGFMISKGWSANRARKTAITVGGLITLPMLALSAVETNPLNFVLLSAVSLFGFQVMINNIQTLPSDFFSGKSVGTLAGLGGTSAVAGVLLFSVWLVPAITKVSYVPFFIMGACLAPLGVLMIYLFAGRIERVQISGEPEDGVRV